MFWLRNGLSFAEVPFGPFLKRWNKIEMLFYQNSKCTPTQQQTFEKMSLTNEPVDCPICFECIGEKNNITTECGHQFHASCLMTNVSRNGFGCPCCRTAMAETPEEDDDTDDDDETSTLLDEPEEPYSDDALRGLRMLTDLLEGNDHDQSDVVAEHQYLTGEEGVHIPAPAPSREAIVRMLRRQEVTYEHLVAWILLDHEEYENQYDELERFSGDLWGRIRIMIGNQEAWREEVIEEISGAAPVEAAPAPFEVDIEPIPHDEDDDDECFAVDRSHVYNDLDEIRMDLARFMAEYAAQPKTGICV
jgi:hypothetical protein